MANFVSRLIACCFLWIVAAFGQAGGTTNVTGIGAGTLIDGKSDKPRQNQVIIIRGSRIESVSDAAAAKIPAGASLIDLCQRNCVAWADRLAYAHFPAGRGSRHRRL